jgi:hypothetical protein
MNNNQKMYCPVCKNLVQSPCGIRNCPIVADTRDPAQKQAEDDWAWDTRR